MRLRSSRLTFIHGFKYIESGLSIQTGPRNTRKITVSTCQPDSGHENTNMKRYSKKILRKFKGREDDKTLSAVSSVALNDSRGAQNSGESLATTQQIVDARKTDLWQIAYEDLSPADKGVLADTQQAGRPSLHRSKTLEVVDDVIEATKKQYEEYQKGGLKIRKGADKDAINVRDIAHKILNATLSFRGIANVLVGGDQTGTASIAWGIVLLGLTVCALPEAHRFRMLNESINRSRIIIIRYARLNFNRLNF